MFTGAILLSIVFKFPVGETTLSDKIPLKVFGYGIFVIGFLAIWLLPSVIEAVNALGIVTFLD